MQRLGIVTGTRIEATCLAGTGAAERRTVVCSGANAARAHELARRLIADGCTALASMGTAGGLDMTVASGTAVIAASIIAPDGTSYATDEAWRAALTVALSVGGLAYRLAPVAGCDAPVAGIAAKRKLFEATHAACCDMESHAVASVAAEGGVRFAAVRVVVDAADFALPLAALASVGADGALRPGALIGALVRRPSDLAAMAGLALASRKALRALRRVAALGGPLIALP